MLGTVIGVKGERCAVQVGKSITLFRIDGRHTTETGDAISGNLDALGRETLRNDSKDESLKVFISRWGCPRAVADDYLAQAAPPV